MNPITARDLDVFYHKISRDLFAATAPPVPDWFTHKKLPESDIPPAPDLKALPGPDIAIMREWIAYMQGKPTGGAPKDVGLPDHLKAFGAAWQAHRDARLELIRRNQMARIVQWRWEYTSAMIAERSKRLSR